MQRIVVLACATLAFGMLASPLRAQQAAGGSVSPTEQPISAAIPPAPPPQAEQLPPPPPFPPMPSSRPSHRWVDIGNHHASRAHHRARAAHAPARRTHHRRTHASRTAHKARAATHFSKKTIRSCHGMSYRQIMRHNSCRALMKQELAAPAHRHRASHRAIHHKASANHKIARHHKAKRRRR